MALKGPAVILCPVLLPEEFLQNLWESCRVDVLVASAGREASSWILRT